MVHHVKGAYNGHLAQAFGEGLRMRGSDLPPLLKLMLLMGTYLNRRYLGRVYAKAQNARGFLREQYDAALLRVDILAMPTTPTTAHRHEPAFNAYSEMMRGFATGNNTMVFDVTGHPSLSVPCAKSNGLPVGLMLTGRHFEDATLLRAAYAYEQRVPLGAGLNAGAIGVSRRMRNYASIRHVGSWSRIDNTVSWRS